MNSRVLTGNLSRVNPASTNSCDRLSPPAALRTTWGWMDGPVWRRETKERRRNGRTPKSAENKVTKRKKCSSSHSSTMMQPSADHSNTSHQVFTPSHLLKAKRSRFIFHIFPAHFLWKVLHDELWMSFWFPLYGLTLVLSLYQRWPAPQPRPVGADFPFSVRRRGVSVCCVDTLISDSPSWVLMCSANESICVHASVSRLWF